MKERHILIVVVFEVNAIMPNLNHGGQQWLVWNANNTNLSLISLISTPRKSKKFNYAVDSILYTCINFYRE